MAPKQRNTQQKNNTQQENVNQVLPTDQEAQQENIDQGLPTGPIAQLLKEANDFVGEAHRHLDSTLKRSLGRTNNKKTRAELELVFTEYKQLVTQYYSFWKMRRHMVEESRRTTNETDNFLVELRDLPGYFSYENYAAYLGAPRNAPEEANKPPLTDAACQTSAEKLPPTEFFESSIAQFHASQKAILDKLEKQEADITSGMQQLLGILQNHERQVKRLDSRAHSMAESLKSLKESFPASGEKELGTQALNKATNKFHTSHLEILAVVRKQGETLESQEERLNSRVDSMTNSLKDLKESCTDSWKKELGSVCDALSKVAKTVGEFGERINFLEAREENIIRWLIEGLPPHEQLSIGEIEYMMKGGMTDLALLSALRSTNLDKVAWFCNYSPLYRSLIGVDKRLRTDLLFTLVGSVTYETSKRLEWIADVLWIMANDQESVLEWKSMEAFDRVYSILSQEHTEVQDGGRMERILIGLEAVKNGDVRLAATQFLSAV